MNIEKMTKLREDLTRVPDIDMHRWFTQTADCGTVGCIAGWCLLFATDAARLEETGPVRRNVPWGHACLPPNNRDEQETAADILGLTTSQAESLFYWSHWPLNYRKAYSAAKTPEARKDVTLRRLDHFIATGGTV